MRLHAFLLLLTAALLLPGAAQADRVGDPFSLQLPEPTLGGGSDLGGPSTLQKVGFYSLSAGASFGSLLLGGATANLLGLEGSAAGVTGILAILAATSVVNYGLARLFDIPVTAGSTLVGTAGGGIVGLGAITLLYLMRPPTQGMEGLAQAMLIVFGGMLTYAVITPLLVLTDPLDLTAPRSTNPAVAFRATIDEPRLAPPASAFSLPLLARSF